MSTDEGKARSADSKTEEIRRFTDSLKGILPQETVDQLVEQNYGSVPTPVQSLSEMSGLPIAKVVREISGDDVSFKIVLVGGTEVALGDGESLMSHRKSVARIVERQKVLLPISARHWPEFVEVLLEAAEDRALPDADEVAVFEALSEVVEIRSRLVPDLSESTRKDEVTDFEGTLRLPDGTLIFALESIFRTVVLETAKLGRRRAALILRSWGFTPSVLEVGGQGKRRQARRWRGKLPDAEKVYRCDLSRIDTPAAEPGECDALTHTF